jgi:hypothetical protein
MNTPLACNRCHHEEPHYEVTACPICTEPTCCDCKDAIAAELGTCGDEDCAVAAIAKLDAEVSPLRRQLAEARAALARIAALDPVTDPMPAYYENPSIDTRYSYTLGTAQGIACVALPGARKAA